MGERERGGVGVLHSYPRVLFAGMLGHVPSVSFFGPVRMFWAGQ